MSSDQQEFNFGNPMQNGMVWRP